MNDVKYCPACLACLSKMQQPDQWACMKCHVVWRIINVIADAYRRAWGGHPPDAAAHPPGGPVDDQH
jgi:hypothetical protein